MKDYSKSKATAERLIKKFGALGTLRKTTTVLNDPNDPSEGGTESTTDYAAQIVRLNFEN